jgi:hypothetical protein
MRHLLTLAAAAFLAVGCARNQDETGAAPDQGDTKVTATDTSAAVQTDSTMGQRPSATDTSFVQQDTTAADATMSTDSVGAQGEVQAGDSSATAMPSETATPSDSSAAGTSDTTADSTAAQ